MLTTRETATVVIFLAFIVFALVHPKSRQSMFDAANGVAKAFFKWKLLSLVALYLAYVALAIYCAWRLQVRDTSLLKDTIIWTVVVGFPTFLGANEVASGTKLVSTTIRQTVGLSALLALYIGLVTFSFPAELAIQLIAVFLTLISVVAKHEKYKDTKRVGKIADFLLAALGIGLIILSTRRLSENSATIDWPATALSLAMNIWLPLVLIPFIYIIGFLMRLEVILTILPFHNNKQKPPAAVRLALVVGLHASARNAQEFAGQWFSKVARLESYRSTREVMRQFRAQTHQVARERKQAARRLKQNAGNPGTDKDGRQLDRREFKETQQALTNLAYVQMGQHRNRLHHYNNDALSFAQLAGLPEDSFMMKVSEGKQHWYCWRRTVTGWVFAIGAGPDIDVIYHYDGAQPPASYPACTSASVWDTPDRTANSRNWDNLE